MFYVDECASCGHKVFPARLACAVCHGRSWTPFPVQGGVVQASTVVRQRYGHPDAEPTVLATVLSDAGPVVLAVAQTSLPIHAAVRLDMDQAGVVSASMA